ncbi:MAG TPA: HAMP domain-containing sensor histidine kinase [Longimicrobiaceae bacterium]|nr:HAMP domain-containing sensor histidine kinase [Longimicrobiaceae bacterium]
MANSREYVGLNLKSPALRSAVDRLLSGLSERTVGHGFDYARAEEYLDLLIELLEGSPLPDFSGFTTPDILLFSHLVQGLRSELLSDSSSSICPSPEDLLELLKELERIQDAVQKGTNHNSFLAGLSSLRGPELMVELAHDLRSPLTSILFLSETLRNGHSGSLNDLQHRQLGIIYSAALTLVSMAGDVIELARGGKSLIEEGPSPFSIGHTFDAICDLVRPMVEEKEIVLHRRGPENDEWLGYPLALSRVLLNLTTNAIKFTEKGFVELEARQLGDGRIEFSVRDSGNGIDKATREHLFEPFRTNIARDRVGFSGAGLGLSICRRLVTGMGGHLELETSAGWGTRFYFTLEVEPVPRP